MSGAAALRLPLPVSVRGRVDLPWILRPAATHVVTAAGRRELLPAALALLGLVVTSGCLLAVAARLRREDVGL